MIEWIVAQHQMSIVSAIQCIWRSGADSGFQVRGAHLKKTTPKFLGYFVWKITILRKKIIFFPILGGARRMRPPPLDPPLAITHWWWCPLWTRYRPTGLDFLSSTGRHGASTWTRYPDSELESRDQSLLVLLNTVCFSCKWHLKMIVLPPFLNLQTMPKLTFRI